MSKKSDDNLDKNRQKQTSFFLYDKKQKSSWIFQHFLGYATGFPLTMLNDHAFKLVKFFDLNFFGLEERKYNEITEGQRNQYIIYMFLGLIPGLLVLFFGLLPYQLRVYKFLNFFFSGNIYNSFFSLFLNIFSILIAVFIKVRYVQSLINKGLKPLACTSYDCTPLYHCFRDLHFTNLFLYNIF